MKRASDRWIGYAVVNAQHVAMSRSHFRDLVNENAFGAALRDGRRILVRESGVRRWLRDGCRSMAQIVNSVDTRPGDVEGMSARAQGRRAGSVDKYAATSDEFDPVAARDGTVPGTVTADHGPSLCSAVRPPGRCMTSRRPEKESLVTGGLAGGTPFRKEKPAHSGRAVVSCGPVFDRARCGVRTCHPRQAGSERHPGPRRLDALPGAGDN